MSIVIQNDGIEETIVGWWNNIPNELKIQKEIESYYEVMEIYPKYPYIWYKLGLAYYAIGYKQKGKEYFHRMKATEKERKREDKMKQFRI
jgi:tetratricopeptide (TPR) repeat protein